MGVSQEIQASLVKDEGVGIHQVAGRLLLSRSPVFKGNSALENEGVPQLTERFEGTAVIPPPLQEGKGNPGDTLHVGRVTGGEDRVHLAEYLFHVVVEGGALKEVQLGAEKGEGHQLLEGKVDGGNVLEAGQEAVALASALQLSHQGIARLVDGVQVAVNGAAVDAGLLGELIDGHAVA